MPAPSSTIEVFQLQPHEAGAYAGDVQGFLRDTLHGLYVEELGRQMIVLANPDDTAPGGAVDRQRMRIAESDDLSVPDTSAYIVARDPARAAHGGLVGLAKLTRKGPREVEIEELDVALDRRGEGIGPAVMEEALGTLAIGPSDDLVLDVLVHNAAGRSFWEGIGFDYTGQRKHHDYAFPDAKDYHVSMTAPEPIVHRRVRERLRPRLT
jgi:ribosomal protein S18 acetylase RimI-like enzyme